ncbi:membrane dipeptidase-domain-containing protein [Amylostereum chailletii]|nr:membrane dipeptidase-domain-containing protein [Amylostereum chailletii]
MSIPTEDTNLLTRLPEERPPNEPKSGGLCAVSTTLRGVLALGFVVALAVMLFWYEGVQDGGANGGHGGPWWTDRLPKDSNKAAAMLLEQAPVIVHLPWLVRRLYANNVSDVDMMHQMPDHVDIPRLRTGRVGGVFWSIYLQCAYRNGADEGPDYVNPTWLVRDTLEQIDVAHLLIDKYKDVPINVTRAPVMFSHSSPRALHPIPRNVPDAVLKHIGQGEGKVDGVVMVPFYPPFISEDPAKANLSAVADHVEHIARLIGRKHVGIGSDFDGIDTTPTGLEDVSKYPDLVAELHRRGWNKMELAGFTGANVLRVMEGAERVAREMAKEGALPAMEIYEKRPDLPMKEKSPV